MSKIKDILYDYLVKKNGRVWYEYERYVREHIEEHYLFRGKHILLLLKLNWFYRVKKNTIPYLYWDVPLSPNIIASEETIIEKKLLYFPESKAYKREDIKEFAKKLSEYDVICFDVFDTLIFRAVSQPDDLFWLMGMRHGIPDYKRMRKQALYEARKNTNKYDVTLEDIYREIEKYYSGDITSDMEIKMESELTYANPYMSDVVNILINKNKKVVAVSDMYLSGVTISKLLENAGYPKLDVYSSCDLNLNKKNGELQNYVKESLGGDKSYIFIGDNYDSDFQASLKAGVDAYWYKSCMKVGEVYRSKADSTIAASTYQAIINNTLHNGKFTGDIYYEHGFVYAGIIVYGFCKWVNQLSQHYQYDKLLFLSRDMEIFYKVYNHIFGKIESEYVKFSRFASQQLIFEYMPEEYLEYTLKTRINKESIKEALFVYDLPTFEQELLENGVNADDKLNNENYQILRTIIFKNYNKICEKFKEANNSAKEYLKKVIGDSKKICVLDLGWKGTAVIYLKKLFDKWNLNVEVRGAIVSIAGNAYAQSVFDSNLLDVYIQRNDINFTAGIPKNSNFETFRGHIFEATFSSCEPSLLEYAMDNDGIAFVYARENPNSKIVSSIQKGIMDFCIEYIERMKGVDSLIKITGFNANTPINKALKTKEYMIPTWGYVLDEASSEPGFSKEPRMNTFFEMMKNAKLVNQNELVNLLGHCDEGEVLYICSTYSQIFITLVKVLTEKTSGVDIMIYDDIPNCFKLCLKLKDIELFNNIMIFTKNGLPPRFHPEEKDIGKLLELHYLHMHAVEQKLQVNLEKYEYIYTYYDGHHLGLYIQEKHIKYHLIEDGMNHFQHIYATPSVQELPELSKENEEGYLRGWKYMCCGQNPDCLSIEVNENKNLAITHPNIIERPREDMLKALSKEEKRAIFNIFLDDLGELFKLKNQLAIVFTSVLVNDGWVDNEKTQIDIYREIVNKLEQEGFYVVIKPHPRDKVIYNKDFRDCYIMDRMFPSEILDFSDKVHFCKGIVIASSAMELLSCIDKKEKLGFSFLEKYKEHMTPWVLESLKHPERYNW